MALKSNRNRARAARLFPQPGHNNFVKAKKGQRNRISPFEIIKARKSPPTIRPSDNKRMKEIRFLLIIWDSVNMMAVLYQISEEKSIEKDKKLLTKIDFFVKMYSMKKEVNNYDY
jgi:hypothetical protein